MMGVRVAAAPEDAAGVRHEELGNHQRLATVEVDIDQPGTRLAKQHSDVLVHAVEVGLESLSGHAQALPPGIAWILVAPRYRDRRPSSG
jgi:hypothetical protein